MNDEKNPRGTKLKCKTCEKELPIPEFFYSKQRREYMKTCKKCNSVTCHKYQSDKRKSGDVNFILRARAAGIRRNCKYRSDNREVAKNLSKLLLEQYTKQKGLCYYTQEPMTLSDYQNDDSFATVDRVDPTKGYIEGNIVFCLSIINKMKQDMSIDQLKFRCQQIINH